MNVNFNHFEDISTIDYPGKSACVVFFNGCPWRCEYCHNKQTWTEVNMVDVNIIKQRIKSCLPYISAVVFSGGEPTMQIEPLMELCKYSKSLGLHVGIETNGYNPIGLDTISPYIDKIFIDIKAPVKDYGVYITLYMDLPIEIRIVDVSKYNTKNIIKSLNNRFKITILPHIKRNT